MTVPHLVDRALVLNPNLAVAWFFSGWIKVWLGEPEVAIERVARAMRLSPHDPQSSTCRLPSRARISLPAAMPRLCHGRKQNRRKPNYGPALRALAASSAMTGQQEQAQKTLARLCELQPSLRISNLKDTFRVRRAEDFARWEAACDEPGCRNEWRGARGPHSQCSWPGGVIVSGLLKAGLPE